jgi:hypothetical protein
MAPEARTITLPDHPAAWAQLGFALGADGAFSLGGVRLEATGAGAFELGVAGLRAERPDGLAIVSAPAAPAGPPAPGEHPIGAIAVDHVVALTDDRARTLAALEAAGMTARRLREPPEAVMPQAFLVLGALVLELVQAGPGPPALWGLTLVVEDLGAVAERLNGLLGEARAAVQPGRRIATLRREAGLSVPLALMTPRPQPGPPG